MRTPHIVFCSRRSPFVATASFIGHCRLAFFAIAISAAFTLPNPSLPKGDPDAFAFNRLLGRGMTLGNALEAPYEGAWGVMLKEDYFQTIKAAGFNSVRIPIRWSAHALQEAPYTIDPTFFKRIDWAVDQALSRNLAVVINVHHYEEMDKDPVTQAPRLTGLWRQIADRYRNRPQALFFELLNEPGEQLSDERWQQIFPDLLEAIRKNNPTRMVIIGGADWNKLDHLQTLKLPENDRWLIATFHYYRPFRFTHQGASWIPGSETWRGTKWDKDQESSIIHEDFQKSALWGQQNARPIYLGEFGTIDRADMESRASWTGAVVREAEQFGFSWSYWEFCANFGAYDPLINEWHRPLLEALLNK